MKIPKKISDLLNQKQAFIDKNRDKMAKSVVKLQNELLNKVIAEVVPALDVKDGIILDTTHNYRVISELDKVYNSFTSASASFMSSQIAGVTGELAVIGEKYFTVALADNMIARFGKVIKSTAERMDLRIGLKGGEMVRGGFMESFLKDPTLGTQIKNYVSKAVTGQIDTKEFIKGLGDVVNGDGGKGALEKQYERFGYDIYQQYDRAYNSSLAEEFDMNYFVYQGGLIDDSRDFCAAHNNKVWTREEAAGWTEWTPSKGEYPEGYEIKSKAPYETPSYLGYPGYQPLIDAGGYNCRHSIGWISDEMAWDLRPDLKE